jgi:carbonic anhydrase
MRDRVPIACVGHARCGAAAASHDLIDDGLDGCRVAPIDHDMGAKHRKPSAQIRAQST